jgi:hypothetical protein
VACFPGPAALADFDRDGKLDVAVAEDACNDVAVLSGDGAGGLWAARGYPAGANGSALVAADFDGDGKVDVATKVLGAVDLLPGDGAGGLAAAVASAVPRDGQVLVAGDLNGDGRPDLVAGQSVLLRAAGGFTAAPLPAITGQPESAALGDLDGDGKLDLALGDGSQGQLSVLIGRGDGTFAAPVVYPAPQAGNGGSAIALGDLDADGDLDVAFAPFFGQIQLLSNDGTGKFGPGDLLSVGAIAVAAGDLDGDGRTDLVAVDGNGVEVFKNQGCCKLVGPVTYSVGQSIGSLALVDLDHDGLLDIASQGRTLTVLLNRSSGFFRAGTFAASGLGGPLAVADLDGDQLPDLVQLSDIVVVVLNRSH